MEVKVIIDLSERAVSTIDKLVNALVGLKSEGPWLEQPKAIVEEVQNPPKPIKAVTKVAKPAKVVEPKEEPVVEDTEEAVGIDEETLRAKVAEASAAGLREQIKDYLKKNYKTAKLADIDPNEYSKVYDAVNEMLGA